MASPGRAPSRRRAPSRAGRRRRPRCRTRVCRRVRGRRRSAGRLRVRRAEQAAVEARRSSAVSVHGASASESRQKRGSPPIAAISLRPRASAFHPTSSGRVRVAAEVDVFDEQVGGEEQVFGGAARPENGAIVADSQDDSGGSAVRRACRRGRSGSRLRSQDADRLSCSCLTIQMLSERIPYAV